MVDAGGASARPSGETAIAREPSAVVTPRGGVAHAGIRCVLGDAAVVAEGLTGAHAIGVAAGDDATMVVVDRDPSTLLAFGARVTTGARGIEVAIPGADALFALEAIDGDRFVVITHAACPTDIDATRCLMARLLGHDGRAIGDPVAIDLPGALRTVRTAASGDSVHVARSHAGTAPRLDRITASAGGLEVRTVGLGDGLDLSEEPTEILGLAVTGGSWAAIWRHGAAEDARSAVVLSTQLDEHEVEALDEALVLDSFQWYAGSLSLIAAFEFARPLHLRLGADGDLRGAPRPLPPGETLPAPFTLRRTAAIVGTGARAAVEVRDGAGDAIATVPLETPGFAYGDITRRPDAFFVALAARDADGVSLTTRDLQCTTSTESGAEPTAPPSP
jgi:hypothetical protein